MVDEYDVSPPGVVAPEALVSCFSGGSVNPARALGPMLVSGSFPMLAMYLIAPVIVAVTAALLYDRFLGHGEEPDV